MDPQREDRNPQRDSQRDRNFPLKTDSRTNTDVEFKEEIPLHLSTNAMLTVGADPRSPLEARNPEFQVAERSERRRTESAVERKNDTSSKTLRRKRSRSRDVDHEGQNQPNNHTRNDDGNSNSNNNNNNDNINDKNNNMNNNNSNNNNTNNCNNDNINNGDTSDRRDEPQLTRRRLLTQEPPLITMAAQRMASLPLQQRGATAELDRTALMNAHLNTNVTRNANIVRLPRIGENSLPRIIEDSSRANLIQHLGHMSGILNNDQNLNPSNVSALVGRSDGQNPESGYLEASDCSWDCSESCCYVSETETDDDVIDG